MRCLGWNGHKGPCRLSYVHITVQKPTKLSESTHALSGHALTWYLEWPEARSRSLSYITDLNTSFALICHYINHYRSSKHRVHSTGRATLICHGEEEKTFSAYDDFMNSL